MASKSSYAFKRLSFQFDNFTPIDEDNCGLYFLSSNTVMLCLAFLQHYGKWESRYAYDLNAQNPQRLTKDDFDLVTEIVDKAIKELMADACKSLEEIEFTLKHMLTVFSNAKEVTWFIEKPFEPSPSNGNPIVTESRYKSSFDYNLQTLDLATGLTTKQEWSLAEILVRSFLKYDTATLNPTTPFSVKSLLEMGNGKSLEEIEYTLKTLLTMLGKDKEIKVYIDKPVAATAGDNATLGVNRESVFEVGSLLETNSVTEVLQIALLDDGTLQLPDINPFNLESKLDKIHDMVELQANSHNQSLTYIWKTFYAGLDINPFLDESFFSLFRRSFHDTGFRNDGPYLQKINILFEMANFNGIAAFTNSYAGYFYTWTHVTFTNIMTAIKECICAIPGAIGGIALNPTINVAPANPVISVHGETINNNITVEPTPITNTVNVSPTPVTVSVSPTPITIVNNVDACCDDGTVPPVITPPETSYPPIDPTNPNSPTTEPYKPLLPPLVPTIPNITELQANVELKNAICGYNFYVSSGFLNFIDAFLSVMTYIAPIVNAIGLSSGIDELILRFGKTDIGGVWLSKIPLTTVRNILTQGTSLYGKAIAFVTAAKFELLKDILIEAATIGVNEYVCGITGGEYVEKMDGAFFSTEIQDSIAEYFAIALMDASPGGDLPFSLSDVQIRDLAYGLGQMSAIYVDYGMYSTTIIEAIDLNSYTQYCPCPEEVPTGCNTNPMLPLPLIAPYNGYEFVSSPFYTNDVDNQVLPFVWSPEYPIIDGSLHTVTFEFDTLYSNGIAALPSDVIGVFDVFIRAQYNALPSNDAWTNKSSELLFDTSYGGLTLPPEYAHPYEINDRFGQCTWEVANGKLKVCVTIKGLANPVWWGAGSPDLSTYVVRFTAQPRCYIGNPSAPASPLSISNNGNNQVVVNYDNIVVPSGGTLVITVNDVPVTLDPNQTSYVSDVLTGTVTVVAAVTVTNPDGSVTTTTYTQVIVNDPILQPEFVPFGLTPRYMWPNIIDLTNYFDGAVIANPPGYLSDYGKGTLLNWQGINYSTQPVVSELGAIDVNHVFPHMVVPPANVNFDVDGTRFIELGSLGGSLAMRVPLSLLPSEGNQITPYCENEAIGEAWFMLRPDMGLPFPAENTNSQVIANSYGLFDTSGLNGQYRMTVQIANVTNVNELYYRWHSFMIQNPINTTGTGYAKPQRVSIGVFDSNKVLLDMFDATNARYWRITDNKFSCIGFWITETQYNTFIAPNQQSGNYITPFYIEFQD